MINFLGPLHHLKLVGEKKVIRLPTISKQKNVYYFFGIQRTPAPLSTVPINSSPIDSNVFFNFFSVSTLPAGISSAADSRRTIVEKAIPAFSANALTVKPVIARAALIWLLVIKLNWPYNRINDLIYKINEFILEIKKCLWIMILHRIAQNT